MENVKEGIEEALDFLNIRREIMKFYTEGRTGESH